MSMLISLLGIVVLLGIAVLMSNNRRSISIRTVGGAFALQFFIGAFILYVPAGQEALKAVSSFVADVLNYGNDGIKFLFGGLVSDDMFKVFGGGGFIFALRVLPMIVFFSALVSVLYYVGIMPWVVKIIGGGLQKLLGTSKAVSMSAAANVFVGQTEAPLVVKPYISRMSESDLFAVMCGGLASIAGSVMAGYAGMGIPLPYLLAASFMAAPGGLLFAKLIMPNHKDEVEQTFDAKDEVGEDDNNSKPANILDAASSGASTGMKMALNVGAMLIAFVALIAMANGLIGFVGGLFGNGEITLQEILGYAFQPLAWVIGTPWNEAHLTGSLIGQKVVVNEFVAFAEYSQLLKDGATLSPKTQAIISFALCGFANFSSIAILVGGLGVIAPSRRKDVARLGLKAVVAGSLSNLMSAAIAGLFIGLGGAAVLG